MIVEAKSGRSKCRGCRQKIEKGSVRFGVVDYTFSSKGSYSWYHLACAKKKVDHLLQAFLKTADGEVVAAVRAELEGPAVSEELELSPVPEWLEALNAMWRLRVESL